jgi:hypothetical protein
MMEVKITHLDKVKFAIHSRSHSVICGVAARVAGILRGLLCYAVSEDTQSRGDRR